MTRELSLESSLLGRAGALAIIASGFATTAVAQSSETSVDFDMPAQSLDQALRSYGVVADKQVMFSVDLVNGKTVGPISGEMTPNEALQTLLADTGLVFETTSSDVILIRTARWEASVTGRNSLQTVQLQDAAPRQIESVDERGDEGSSAVSEAEGDVFQQLEEIVVTGTNIRGVENPTVPVLQFDREDIDLSGAATVDDFLRTIPQNFASETQLSVESGNPNDSGRNLIQGTSVDLRGLGAGSTLTLLNGRRMTASGQTSTVDVNVLPLGAIERVDILTDGATAVYGSDAVGGVVNFITRKDFEGFDINARYGTVTDGSKEDWGVGGAGGVNWGSGGIFAGVDYQEARPLLVEERDFIDTTLSREGGTQGSTSERLSFAGSVNQELTSSVRIAVDALYTDLSNETFSISSGTPRTNSSKQTALFVNSRLEYDVTDDITASVYMDYGRNRADITATDPSTADTLNNLDFFNDLFVYEGRLSGGLLSIPGGDVSFSAGGLYRKEEYEQLNVGLGTVDGERDVYAGYVELLIPLVGDRNAFPFVQDFDLSLAVRIEDYSDVGESIDPKIGLYWEVNDHLSLRASYSEAFRAPDLQSLNLRQIFSVGAIPTSLFTSVTPPDPTDIVPFPGFATYLLPAGGNPDLQSETAETWSAGLAYEPRFIEGLALKANYFNVKYNNRLESIFFIETIQIPAFGSLVNVPPNLDDIEQIFVRANAGEIDLLNSLEPFLAEPLAPEDIQVLFAPELQNVAERDISGFDLAIDYSKETDVGHFAVGANMSYFIDYVGRLSETSDAVEQLNILYRPIDFKLRGNASWSIGGFTAFAAVNYADGYRDKFDPSIADSIDAWTTVDLSLAYNAGERFDNSFADGTRIGFSVTNLFDNDPPFVRTPFGLNYDTANANPFGRIIRFTVSKQF